MKMSLFLGAWCLLTTLLPVTAQSCDQDGCGDQTAAEMPALLGRWPSDFPNCNGDDFTDILDLLCLFNTVPELNPPVLAVVGNQVTAPDETLEFQLSATDRDKDPLTFAAENLPARSSFDPQSRTFSFSPDRSQTGNHRVTFTVSDGFLFDTETITITVQGSLVLQPQTIAVLEDGAVTVPLLVDDPPPNLSFHLSTPPLQGDVVFQEDGAVYRPHVNVNGVDVFWVVATDGVATSDPTPMQVGIIPRNDAPAGTHQIVIGAVDVPLDVELTGSDRDGDELSFDLGDAPTNGVLTGTPPNMRYTPNPGFVGADQFTFTPHDGTVAGEPGVVQIQVVLGSPVLDSHDDLTGAAQVRLSGRAPHAEQVRVKGPAASLDVPVVDGVFTVDVPLKPNSRNTLFFTALRGALRGAPSATSITHDSQAPTLSVLFPENGGTLTHAATDVSGTVGDLLSGALGLSVTVNGVPAVVDVGIGTNGSFLAEAVPLNPDAVNELIVVATDPLGNSTTQTVAVRRQSPETGQPLLQRVRGNAQEGFVDRRLPQPLVVALQDADGNRFANKLVRFEVARSDGLLGADETTQISRELLVRTDNAGEARVWWKMGMDAGCGNNRVAVTSGGIVGSIDFCASAQPAPATQINLGTGDMQRVEVGAPACEPLVVWVNDGCNGVAEMPVTFTVLRGDGSVNGASEIVVETERTGHARVRYRLGNVPGNHLIRADFPGNPGPPVFFNLEGLVRDERFVTRMVGLVVDNGNRPIGGAACRLITADGFTYTARTEPDGRFSFDDVVDGPADLYVDGLTATLLGGEVIPRGSFPSLHFLPILIPNTTNEMVAPIKLPALNPANAVLFDNSGDVVLRVDGIEGLEMRVKAGSMRLPDGSVPDAVNPAVLSLNTVHPDDVPMPMPDGAAPPFAWTLQPGGAVFDPPIEIRYPNMSGLAPGALAFFLSFNHDTNNFEIVSTGSVSEDGATIHTDPGQGLTVAGWGGNCPPYAVNGNAESCPVGRGGPNCDPCGRGRTGANCDPCPPNSRDPNCLPCPPGTRGRDCTPCPNNNCDDQPDDPDDPEDDTGCEVPERCLGFALGAEKDIIGDNIKKILKVFKRFPMLDVDEPVIRGEISAEGCSGCCEGQPVQIKNGEISGSVTASAEIQISAPEYEFKEKFNSPCGRMEIEWEAFLGPSVNISAQGLTSTVTGSYDGCYQGQNTRYCLSASTGGSLGFSFGLSAATELELVVCGEDFFEAEIEARLEASVDLNCNLEMEVCSDPSVETNLNVCADDVTVTGSLTVDIDYIPDFSFSVSGTLYEGNCEDKTNWARFAGFDEAAPSTTGSQPNHGLRAEEDGR